MNKSRVGEKAGKIISHLLVIAWMVVIFSFSAQPGDESADLSGTISHLFMRVWNWVFGFGWDEAKVLAMTEIWDCPIRKLAHMTEFGILVVLIFLAIRYYRQIDSRKKHFGFSWLGAVGYALTDELHQRFVPGRSGNLFDVCVDAAGALLALVVVYVGLNLLIRIRKR